jgi:hypothetical protein
MPAVYNSMALTDTEKIQDFLDHLDRQIGDITSRSDAVSSGIQSPPRDGSLVGEQQPRLRDDEEDGNTWCERSLEQLEMTIQLLDQCLDNDLKELNRQRGIIAQCTRTIAELKKVTSQ